MVNKSNNERGGSVQDDPGTAEAMESSNVRAQIRAELMGRSHASADELKSRAESCVEGAPVPVDVLEANDREIHLILRPAEEGEVHVYAERTYPWHPFYVRAVEV